jgi:hypothetical protein
MGERLTEYESWLKDISFFKRIRNVKIFNPNIHLIMDERIKSASSRIAGYWWSGPVHMNIEGYRVVAEALGELVEECSTGITTATSGGTSAMGGGDKRCRRESWISNDDAVVCRAPETKKWRGEETTEAAEDGEDAGGAGEAVEAMGDPDGDTEDPDKEQKITLCVFNFFSIKVCECDFLHRY